MVFKARYLIILFINPYQPFVLRRQGVSDDASIYYRRGSGTGQDRSTYSEKNRESATRFRRADGSAGDGINRDKNRKAPHVSAGLFYSMLIVSKPVYESDMIDV